MVECERLGQAIFDADPALQDRARVPRLARRPPVQPDARQSRGQAAPERLLEYLAIAAAAGTLEDVAGVEQRLARIGDVARGRPSGLGDLAGGAAGIRRAGSLVSAFGAYALAACSSPPSPAATRPSTIERAMART